MRISSKHNFEYWVFRRKCRICDELSLAPEKARATRTCKNALANLCLIILSFRCVGLLFRPHFVVLYTFHLIFYFFFTFVHFKATPWTFESNITKFDVIYFSLYMYVLLAMMRNEQVLSSEVYFNYKVARRR